MPRRQSISNRSESKILPSSYQPEPIPMMRTGPQYRVPSVAYNNSFKNNRVAPPPMDYNTYLQPSIIAPNPRIPASYQKPTIDSNYPNQYYNDPVQNDKPKSCWSKPLCLGLTRLSGGILFGTMIFLSIASISGLITSIVLYLQDITTDPQWKILGMVVCAIMLLTVFVTLCIFIYCYKKGHIINKNNMNLLTPSYNQENDYRHPFNYNQSPIPYGRMRNISPTSNDEYIVPVQDKLTNTEKTISPLRPRDIQRGVWHGKNAYNGLSHRPIEPPKMTNRVIQALPHEIDQNPLQQGNQVVDIVPQTIIRLPDNHREKRSRHFIEPEPQYEIVEEVIRKPRRQRQNSDEYAELPKKEKPNQRFNKVSVKHVKTNEEPDFVVDDDYNTDHFYQ